MANINDLIRLRKDIDDLFKSGASEILVLKLCEKYAQRIDRWIRLDLNPLGSESHMKEFIVYSEDFAKEYTKSKDLARGTALWDNELKSFISLFRIGTEKVILPTTHYHLFPKAPEGK